ncbi:hypothetical protein KC352_g39940, partial [Hortaea werneckii]
MAEHCPLKRCAVPEDVARVVAFLSSEDGGWVNAESSPYVLPFVRTLESAGHTVSVILPDSQRSWIGKAHMVGQDVQATHYWPPQETPETHSSSVS